MADTYKPKLKMGQFKKTKREYTEEDMQDAIRKASARFMEPETMHDVKISAIVKDSVKFNENNPTWMQFGITLENASGETANFYILLPVGQTMDFVSKTGSKTSMPLANWGKFITALGLQGHSTAFIDRIVETDAECLDGLIGFQLRYIAKWNRKKVHPWYDSEKQGWFIVDAEGRIVIDEPFQLPGKDEVEKPEMRWAEMANRCIEEGFVFETQPQSMLLPLPSIRNPINQLGISVVGKNALDRAKVAEADKATIPAKKPAVAKVTKVVTKKAPPPPPVEEEEEEEVEDTEEEEIFDPSELESDEE